MKERRVEERGGPEERAQGREGRERGNALRSVAQPGR